MGKNAYNSNHFPSYCINGITILTTQPNAN